MVRHLVSQMVRLRCDAGSRRRCWQGVRLDLGPCRRRRSGQARQSGARRWSPAAMSRRRSGSRSAARSPALSRMCWWRRASGSARDSRLISLEARELKAAVVQAQGAVAQAEARMRQLDELTLPAAREALTQAQANLLNAQHTFDRTSQLDAERLCDPRRARRRAEDPRRGANPGANRRTPGLHRKPRRQRLCDGADPAQSGPRQSRHRGIRVSAMPRSRRPATAC